MDEKADAVSLLRHSFHVVKGSRVATLVTARSASGMTRWVRVLVATLEEGQTRVCDVTYTVARATGLPFDEKKDAIKVGGCGFDAGHHVVDALMGAMGEGVKLSHDRL